MSGFRRAGVVGLGTMGAGIAEVLARGGLDVVGVEVDAAALERGRTHLVNSTGRAVRRGRLTEEEQAAILDRVALSTEFPDLRECDLVIEAVPERLELKRRVFAELDRVCGADAVLATNTSSLSVTEIAATTGRPAAVVGVHFFNPAPVMKLVEVIGTVRTDPRNLARMAELVRELGKVPVTIGDRAGFIANRLLFGYLNQAAGMYDSGHASREDIDTAMRAGTGLPMGPLTLLDLIGLDTSLEVLEAVHRETRDRRHAPAPILRELVTAGLLGRKTGRGFYTYEASDAPAPEPETERPLVGVTGSGSVALGLIETIAGAGHEVRTDRDRLTECDLVIDAVPGNAEVKRSSLAAVSDIAKRGAILATAAATEPVPVIDVAMATDRPGDVVGLHVPGPAADLVEIATTVRTGDGVARRAVALAGRLGLRAVRCRDRAGFIVDALRFPYLNDAVRMLDAGYADADAIDTAMTLGCGYPVGPIADLDRLGPDRAAGVLRALYAESREPALAPAPLLAEYVTAGRSIR